MTFSLQYKYLGKETIYKDERINNMHMLSKINITQNQISDQG